MIMQTKNSMEHTMNFITQRDNARQYQTIQYTRHEVSENFVILGIGGAGH